MQRKRIKQKNIEYTSWPSEIAGFIKRKLDSLVIFVSFEYHSIVHS